MRAGLVWRSTIVLALVLAAAALALSPFLFRLATKASDEARSASAANTATICSIGSFLTQSPITRLPGVSDRDFRRQLFVARAFLVDLRELECRRGAFGRAVRPRAIERQITAIQRALDQLPHRPRPDRQAGSSGETGSPAGAGSEDVATGGASTAAPPPTPPSIGGDGSSGGSPGGDQPGDGDGPGPGTTPGPAPPGEEPTPVEQVADDVAQTIEHAGELGQQVACQVAQHNPLCP